MIKAVFLDFYGTLVHEDDDLISIICKQIHAESELQNEISAGQIGRYWWHTLSSLFNQSYGENFKTQRELEIISIQRTLSHFASKADASALAQILFEYWRKPSIYVDSLKFLHAVKMPLYILSNIDRSDILPAAAHHNFYVDHVITSEDVRSYKPRPEMFVAALKEAALKPDEVLHVGDSVSSDVVGACRMGIPVAWINRTGKTLRSEYTPNYVIKELTDVMSLLPY